MNKNRWTQERVRALGDWLLQVAAFVAVVAAG